MALEIRVPSFGESITESTVARWLRENGSWVEKGEPVVTLDTEKASSDVEAPASGVLKVLAAEGADVAIGAVIAEIDETAGRPAGGAAIPQTRPSVLTRDEPSARPPGAPPAGPETPSVPDVLPEVRPEAQPEPAVPRPSPAPLPAAGRTETRKPMTRLRRTIAYQINGHPHG